MWADRPVLDYRGRNAWLSLGSPVSSACALDYMALPMFIMIDFRLVKAFLSLGTCPQKEAYQPLAACCQTDRHELPLLFTISFLLA